jgi:DNA-directed RNA polymerase subunit RPC12/RpoP
MLLKYRCAACKWESEPIGVAPYNCVNCGSTAAIEPVPEKAQPVDHPANADAESALHEAVASAAEHIAATHPPAAAAAAAPNATTTTTTKAAKAGSQKE